MPLVSALNGDSVKIPDGAPVAGRTNRLQLDHVILAGGSVLCAGLAKSGAINGGLINVLTDGILDLDNWIHVTGSRTLQVGRTYRLSSQKGKLTTAGTKQIVGLAISGNQISLQIGAGEDAVETSTPISYATTSQLAAEAAARGAADATLQAQLDAVDKPEYAKSFLLGGM